MKKLWFLLAFIGLSSIALFLQSPKENGENIKLCGFAGIIPNEVLSDFTDETGIKVSYTPCSIFDEVETKLVSGEYYDLVVMCGWPYFERMVDIGLLSELSKDEMEYVENIQHIDKIVLNKVSHAKNHGIPFVWGCIAIGVNTSKIIAFTEQSKKKNPKFNIDTALENVYNFFNSSFLSDISSFGKIVFFDAPLEIFSHIFYAQPEYKNEFKLDELNIKNIYDILIKNRKYIDKFDANVAMIDELSSDVVVYYGMADDINRTMQKLNKNGQKISIFKFKQTPLLWIDVIAITKKCKNRQNALKFINYVMRPDVYLKICQKSGAYSVQSLSHEDKVFIKNAKVLPMLSVENLRIIRRYWRNFKKNSD